MITLGLFGKSKIVFLSQGQPVSNFNSPLLYNLTHSVSRDEGAELIGVGRGVGVLFCLLQSSMGVQLFHRFSVGITLSKCLKIAIKIKVMTAIICIIYP